LIYLFAENADFSEGYNKKSVFADAFVIPLGVSEIPLKPALGAHLTILKIFVTRIVTLFVWANLGCFKQRPIGVKNTKTWSD
jgi:hypothetical protein